jgi:T5orf172 domain.
MAFKYFYTWLEDQTNRDNLIGDIALTIKSDEEIDVRTTYIEMKEIVTSKVTDYFEIQSLNDWERKGKVHPSLCLELAFREYEFYLEKKKLSKYIRPSFDGYVYFICDPKFPNEVKIGRARDVTKRIASFNTGRPRDLKLIRKIYSGNYKVFETDIHNYFKNQRIKREWFEITKEELADFFNNLNDIIVSY